MVDISNFVIALMGVIINILVNWLHHQRFILRYKNYKKIISEKIIKKYKDRLNAAIRNNDSTKLEDEIKKILEDLNVENEPLKIFDETNKTVYFSIISLGISIITNLLFSRYNMNIVYSYTWGDISFFTLVVGFILFMLGLLMLFQLSRKITQYELNGISKK